MAIFAKDIVMQIIIKDLGDLGINFQNFVSEKSLYSSCNFNGAIFKNPRRVDKIPRDCQEK